MAIHVNSLLATQNYVNRLHTVVAHDCVPLGYQLVNLLWNHVHIYRYIDIYIFLTLHWYVYSIHFDYDVI